ncbi:MAG: hypothetical protein WBN13_02100 [Robiginitalea sp.]|jgi:hypothetical protein|uniref:hypothetical protein n=1 Tax=Robiginitalea sp. TaxID=1902411 RepID=UPI003C73C510
MTKIVILGMCLILAGSCKSPDQKEPQDEPSMIEAELQALPDLVPLSPQAQEIVNAWPEYTSLENRLAALRDVKNWEEMELLLEELDQICKQVEENAFPQPFEKPSVRSRIKVLRTYLGKLEAANYYRLDYQEPISELMDAINAIRQQFNVIVNNNLTPDVFENN